MIKMFWLAIIIPIVTCAQTETEVQFTRNLSWREILTKARAGNKYIFMDVYASWCGPCKAMDQTVYTNDTVTRYLDSNFLSVKVQMDSTGHDDQAIKNWYAESRAINTKYKIEGYPSFLFFTPRGELIYRGIGYHDVGSFMKMVSFALDPKRKDCYVQLENYKEGKRNYSVMMPLVRAARDLIGDTALANRLAADYKTNFLDKLSLNEICKEEILEFIKENATLVNSKDIFFYLFYNEPKCADSIFHENGLSARIVDYIIIKEEIQAKLWQGTKLITENPDWERIYLSITEKYSKDYAEHLIPQARIDFYRRIKNWNEFVRLREKQIREHPPRPNTSSNALLQDSWGLNIDAWELFLNCDNKALLAKALKWSELSISLYPSEAEQLPCIDTKANLLYKLGMIKEAIILEKKVIRMASDQETKKGSEKGTVANEYINVLYKMKNGQPTWTIK